MSTRAYEHLGVNSRGLRHPGSPRQLTALSLRGLKKKLPEGQTRLREEESEKMRKNLAQKAFTTIAVPTRTPICARTCGISAVF